MCDQVSLCSPVDQMHAHASKLEENFMLGKFLGEKNDFYLRFRDCFTIWNSPNSFDFQKSCTK